MHTLSYAMLYVSLRVLCASFAWYEQSGVNVSCSVMTQVHVQVRTANTCLYAYSRVARLSDCAWRSQSCCRLGMWSLCVCEYVKSMDMSSVAREMEEYVTRASVASVVLCVGVCECDRLVCFGILPEWSKGADLRSARRSSAWVQTPQVPSFLSIYLMPSYTRAHTSLRAGVCLRLRVLLGWVVVSSAHFGKFGFDV